MVDAFDARNYFSERVEPLEQHQFGVTGGGPLRRDRVFFFGYYEGFRNTQGITTTATVPTAAERDGDFSGLGTPLLNIAAGGVPFANNKIPAAAINPVARNVLAMYPLGNVSPAAAVPIEEKMPAPITAPIASMIKSPAPSSRRRPLGSSPPASKAAIGLREKSEFTPRWYEGSEQDGQC